MNQNGPNTRSNVEKPNHHRPEQQGIEHIKCLLNSLFYGISPSDQNGDFNTKDSKAEEEGKGESSYADQVMAAIRIDDHIPTDPKMIRQTKIYQSAYKAIQWQRDNYLVGTEYANWRTSERQRERRLHRTIRVSEIPYDQTASGHIQFSQLAVNFLPSETMHRAVLPLVVGLPMGPIYPVALKTVLSLIPVQQTRLDGIIKTSVLAYLDNPANRVAIKNTTQGFIYRRSGGILPKQAEPSSKTQG